MAIMVVKVGSSSSSILPAACGTTSCRTACSTSCTCASAGTSCAGLERRGGLRARSARPARPPPDPRPAAGDLGRRTGGALRPLPRGIRPSPGRRSTGPAVVGRRRAARVLPQRPQRPSGAARHGRHPGRQRERRDRDGGAELRRQRRARGAACDPAGGAVARPAHGSGRPVRRRPRRAAAPRRGRPRPARAGARARGTVRWRAWSRWHQEQGGLCGHGSRQRGDVGDRLRPRAWSASAHRRRRLGRHASTRRRPGRRCCAEGGAAWSSSAWPSRGSPT